MDNLNSLSNRSKTTLASLQEFGFQATQQVKPSETDSRTPIDASLAENWCIRPELLSLFQDIVRTELGAQHLSYPDSHLGDSKALAALSSFFNQHFRPHKQVEDVHIALAPGSSKCLTSLLYHLCDPGDGVLVPALFWNGFDFHFSIGAQVHPVVAPLNDIHDAFNPESLLESLNETFSTSPYRIRALVLTHPGNPLGQCYSVDTLRLCARFCHDREIHLICDEVYALSYFGGTDPEATPFQSILSVDLDTAGCDLSRIHVVWSMSKDFGCSGLRLGCVISQANPTLILGLRLPTSTEVSSLSALCTTAFLSSPKLPELIELSTARLKSSYCAVTSVFEAHGVEYIPAAAGLYVFARLVPQAKTLDDEVHFKSRLRERGLLVSPGRAYHIGPERLGWFRFTFALEETVLRRALDILENCLDSDTVIRTQ